MKDRDILFNAWLTAGQVGKLFRVDDAPLSEYKRNKPNFTKEMSEYGYSLTRPSPVGHLTTTILYQVKHIAKFLDDKGLDYSIAGEAAPNERSPQHIPHTVKQIDIASENEIIALAQRKNPNAGVYFLVYSDEIVYIGRSENIHQRMTSHKSAKKFDFDSSCFIPIDDLGSMKLMESFYIRTFRPKHNSIKESGGVGLMSAKKITRALAEAGITA